MEKYPRVRIRKKKERENGSNCYLPSPGWWRARRQEPRWQGRHVSCDVADGALKLASPSLSLSGLLPARCTPAPPPGLAHAVPSAGDRLLLHSFFFCSPTEDLRAQASLTPGTGRDDAVALGVSDSASVAPSEPSSPRGWKLLDHMILCEHQEGWATLPLSLLCPQHSTHGLAHSWSSVNILTRITELT